MVNFLSNADYITNTLSTNKSDMNKILLNELIVRIVFYMQNLRI